MDGPGLDPDVHRLALHGLGRINVVSRSVAPLWRYVERAARENPSRPLRLLDLACGGGHVAVELARRAQRSGMRLDVLGTDISDVALEYARDLANQAGVRVSFERLDAVHEALPEVDVCVASLFFHHLARPDAVALLHKMAAAARVGGVVSDLRRTAVGYVFAWVGCRLVSRSHVVHVDGGRSVRAAFSSEDARALAADSGLTGATVSHHWPQRWVLSWTRAAAAD